MESLGRYRVDGFVWRQTITNWRARVAKRLSFYPLLAVAGAAYLNYAFEDKKTLMKQARFIGAAWAAAELK
jgi:hypothetical protein